MTMKMIMDLDTGVDDSFSFSDALSFEEVEMPLSPVEWSELFVMFKDPIGVI